MSLFEWWWDPKRDNWPWPALFVYFWALFILPFTPITAWRLVKR